MNIPPLPPLSKDQPSIRSLPSPSVTPTPPPPPPQTLAKTASPAPNSSDLGPQSQSSSSSIVEQKPTKPLPPRFPLSKPTLETDFPPLLYDHDAVLRSDYATPFSGATDVVRRLLPWHVWQVPPDVIALAKGKGKALPEEVEAEAHQTGQPNGRHASDLPPRKRRRRVRQCDDSVRVPRVEKAGQSSSAPFERIEGLDFPTSTVLDGIVTRYQAIRDSVRRVRHRAFAGNETKSEGTAQDLEAPEPAPALFAKESHLQLLRLSHNHEKTELDTALADLKQARFNLMAQYGGVWQTELDKVAPGLAPPPPSTPIAPPAPTKASATPSSSAPSQKPSAEKAAPANGVAAAPVPRGSSPKRPVPRSPSGPSMPLPPTQSSKPSPASSALPSPVTPSSPASTPAPPRKVGRPPKARRPSQPATSPPAVQKTMPPPTPSNPAVPPPGMVKGHQATPRPLMAPTPPPPPQGFRPPGPTGPGPRPFLPSAPSPSSMPHFQPPPPPPPPQPPIRVILPLNLISKLTQVGIAPLPAPHLQPAIDAHKRRAAAAAAAGASAPTWGAPSDDGGEWTTAPCEPKPDQSEPAVLLGITEASAPDGTGEWHQLVHLSLVLNKLNPAQLTALAEAVNLVQGQGAMLPPNAGPSPSPGPGPGPPHPGMMPGPLPPQLRPPPNPTMSPLRPPASSSMQFPSPAPNGSMNHAASSPFPRPSPTAPTPAPTQPSNAGRPAAQKGDEKEG